MNNHVNDGYCLHHFTTHLLHALTDLGHFLARVHFLNAFSKLLEIAIAETIINHRLSILHDGCTTLTHTMSSLHYIIKDTVKTTLHI